MAISDRINEMYTHVGDVYDTITNVDLPTNKNIQNIPSTMRSSYLEIMNNGIDKIWNNWEKVTGEGETLTLNSTEEAPMKIDLKGNTSQETTTGKNLLENTLQSQTANGITFIRNNDGSLTFSGTATQAHSITGRFTKNLVLMAGTTYILSLGNKQAGYGVYLQKEGNANVWYLGVGATNSNLTITPTEDTTIVQLAIHFPNGNTVNGTIYPMIRLASITNDTYEPYTNGASPNPDYPQDIHVVSGDNSINVCGKNLWDEDYTNIQTNLTYKPIYVGDGIFTLSTTMPLKQDNFTNMFFLEGNVNTGASTSLNGVSNGVPRTQQSANGYVTIAYRNSDNMSPVNYQTQLELGNQSTTYEPYQGASYPITLPEGMFLGWIPNTDYRDIIFQAKTGDTYYDSLDSTTKESLTYGKWYLNKQIGKFIYNNEGSVSTPKTNYYNISGLGNQGWINTIGTNTYLSNEYPSTNVQNTDANFQTDTANMGYAFDIHLNGTGMRFKDSRGLSGANFKTDLIGTKFYFALSTPTTTEITDSTLLSQLEALNGARSYENQTNINQDNNDLPFILDVTALKELTQ